MCYASFMLTKYYAEKLNQNDDYKCCVTGVTGITGTLYLTQDRRIDITEEFGHEVEEANTDSKKKRPVAALAHLQDYMHAINHKPSKWKDMEYDQMYRKFWVGFANYMGKHANNKTMVKFPWGKKTASKKAVMSRAVASTATLTNNVCQISSSN